MLSQKIATFCPYLGFLHTYLMYRLYNTWKFSDFYKEEKSQPCNSKWYGKINSGFKFFRSNVNREVFTRASWRFPIKLLFHKELSQLSCKPGWIIPRDIRHFRITSNHRSRALQETRVTQPSQPQAFKSKHSEGSFYFSPTQKFYKRITIINWKCPYGSAEDK